MASADRPPLIAIDLSCLESEVWTGVERRAVAIASRLPLVMPECRVIGLARKGRAAAGVATGLEILGTVRVLGSMPRPLWRRALIPGLATRLGVRLHFSPVAHAVVPANAVAVRTIHDLPPAGLVAGVTDEPGVRRTVPRHLSRDLPTICTSEATSRDLDRLVPGLAAPRAIIGNAAAPHFFTAARSPRPAAAGTGAYVLVVGRVRERRRPALVRAAAERAGLRVVWAGPIDGRAASDRWIEYLGAVDDRTLLGLYDHAALLLSPSRIEGFGIPVVEAFARGLPVVAARCDALLEVAGDLAHWFEGGDAGVLGALLAQVAAEPRDDRARERRRDRARRFDWDASAAAHAAFFRRLLEARAAPSGRP